jgi:GMP synthase-like glutamine amidotransferase
MEGDLTRRRFLAVAVGASIGVGTSLLADNLRRSGPVIRNNMNIENLLTEPLSPEMRQRYEEDAERAAGHHNRLAQDLAPGNDILAGKSLLCVEQFGTSPSWPAYLAKLDPERRKLLDLGLAGGPHTIHGEIFAYQLGFSPEDIKSGRFQIWRASHGEPFPPRPLTDYAGVVMTGSDRMVTELWNPEDGDEAPWMRNVVSLSRKLKDHNIPGLYVCFGHQIYAASQYFDSEMGPDEQNYRTEGAVDWIKNAQGKREREFGPVTLQLTPQALLEPILEGFQGDSFTVAASHSQHVPASRRPTQAKLLALNAEGLPTSGNPAAQSQMFAYESGREWSIQNHPELTGAVLDVVSDMRAKAIMAEVGEEGFLGIKDLIRRHQTNTPREILMKNFLQIAGKMQRGEAIR